MPSNAPGAETAPPAPPSDAMVTVQLELSVEDAERLRQHGGSAWVTAQLARAGASGPPGASAEDAVSDYLAGLARAIFPLPVSGSAVRLVDALRKQRMVEAAVTYDEPPGGEGDRAIVIDITSLGRAEIERLGRASSGG